MGVKRLHSYVRSCLRGEAIHCAPARDEEKKHLVIDGNWKL